ncbi:MAG: DUF1254 domain-containing protein [Acidobacteriia bacterium]|nr:DUF1254 domain-containing protein [Terriglobia bacterium]
MRGLTGSVLAIYAVGLVQIAAGQSQQPAPSPSEIREIASQAYTFAYPLVLMEYTRRSTLAQASQLGAASTNEFTHAAAFPDDKFRRVIRPNADTLYSASWLDLSKEPVLLHVADTHGRYYLMQFLDAWTETFSVPGKRTTGTGDEWFAVVGPGWRGTLPARAQRIDSPTNMVWLIGRTQTNNASDYANVHAIQKGFVLMPLSLYPDGPRPTGPRPPASPAAEPVPPPVQVERLNPVEFFRTFADLLAKNPPHAADAPMLRQLARIGIAPGKPFHPEALGADGLKALEAGAQAASAHLLDPLSASNGRPMQNGWADTGGTVGKYGANYAARAAIARFGLGALPSEDAIYVTCKQDANGKPLDGSHPYRMHFSKAQVPPVRAFWSLTMYGEDGYFAANPIHRFAIGDRDPLKFNPDGSLDLYIQHDSPSPDRASNWLPAPAGKFNLILRLYWPKDEVLNGRWTAPPVTP